MTNKTSQRPNDDEQSAYEELAVRTRQALGHLTEISGDALERAIAEAKEQTESKGKFSSEQLEKATDFLRRDLAELKNNSQQAKAFIQRQLDPSRIASTFIGLASDVMTFSGDILTSFGERFEAPIRYRTGEVTGPGTLTCLKCGTQLHFAESGKIPPCGNCHETEFRKSY